MKNFRKWKRVALFVCAIMVVSCVYIKFPAKAALVYPNQYVYIKPAPYWTSDPCDEFGTSQGVTILERDYNFFYVEYTRGGVKKRGYLSCDWITASGYSWPNHTEFNPGYNNTSSSITVYYGPGTSYGVSGSIDADEGEVDSKPLLVLGYNGSYAYVQYITNPDASTSTHKKFKRGWVLKSSITVKRPSSIYGGINEYVLLSWQGEDTYLTAVADNTAESGYSLKLQAGTGNQNQWWQLVQQNDASGAVYYKIKSVSCNKYLEVTGAIPVINTRIKLANLSSPNKAQEFYFEGFYIKTRCSGGYMSLLASGADVYQHTAESFITRVWNKHAMRTYWEGKYTCNESSLICVFNAGYEGNITENTVNAAISAWNNIASISISRPATYNHLDILMFEDNTITEFAGRMEPQLTASSSFLIECYDYQLHSNWFKTRVRLNYNSADIYNSLNTVDRTTVTVLGVLTHELGHCLKMKHPHGEGEGSQKIYSVMNQGFNQRLGNYAASTPTQYDRYVFDQKW